MKSFCAKLNIFLSKPFQILFLSSYVCGVIAHRNVKGQGAIN
jgi:hypothetical protein